MRAENTYSYFLVSPALVTPCTTLLSRVFQILKNLPNQGFVLYSPIFVRAASNALNGSRILLPDVNLQLFDVMAQYVVNSQWFAI